MQKITCKRDCRKTARKKRNEEKMHVAEVQEKKNISGKKYIRKRWTRQKVYEKNFKRKKVHAEKVNAAKSS